MSELSTDHTDHPAEGSALTRADHDAVKDQVESILSLDDILSSATRAERTVSICINGAIRAEYESVIAELGELVDAEGNILDENGGEASMAEEAHAAQLRQRANKLHKAMREATVDFRFRAMPADEFELWDEAHRGGSAEKRIKDTRKYEDELIAMCAISPVMDVAGVAKLRKQFGISQVTALFNGAFFANKADGLDVPKSPSFLHAPKPQE